ncbi:MAG: hypothetical protein LAT55_04085 [Opitutales bacterium]|nr:hypothetical protein [Opitutales bacterium]
MSAVSLFGGPAANAVLATPERLLRINQGLMEEHPHFTQAYELMVSELSGQGDPQWRVEGSNWSYERSYKAQKEAFLYALTGEAYWAERAYRTLQSIYADPDPDGRFAERGNSGLSRATVGLGFALAYNWCRDAWDEEQQAFVHEVLQKSLAMWEEYNHHNFGAYRKSNWVAVCRGAELMQILALGEEKVRAERYEFLVGELFKHARNGYDQIGASQEGIGYTSYGAIFLLPAAIAAADRGDPRLFEFLQEERHWHQKLMYSGSFAQIAGEDETILAGGRAFLHSGVGGPNTNDQGFASVVLGTTPKAKLPPFLWWYDRHMGYRSTEFGFPPEALFEPQRQGRIWALLFYPWESARQSPEILSTRLVYGEQGRHYFRNRWQDSNDILIAFHQHLHWLPRAWFQPEVGALSLFAYDTLFLSGPRTRREPGKYNRLLVNGSRGSGSQPGNSLYRDLWEEEGYYAVAVEAADSFAEEEGVVLYERHLLVGLGNPQENDAVIVTLDRVETKEEGIFTWNAYTGLEERLGGWSLNSEMRGKGEWSSFILQGTESGGLLQGTVLAPGDVLWTQEENRWVAESRGQKADILVALALHPETPPEIEKLGSSDEYVDYRIGAFTFRWDRANNRLQPLLFESTESPRGRRAQLRSRR